ncbi:MAG TPA: 2-hydroxyacid dehydrogenase [Roseiarcus sp.]|nr:2-hydroxyacid dehydrogenase [Roseiarcus sp.]
MSKPTVLMTGAYPQWDLQPMERDYDLRKLWLAADKDGFLEQAAPKARAIATRGELGASAALMDKCPKLEIIACYGVGVDAIDLAKARARGVRVTNTPDVLTEDVADFAFALMLAHLRKVVDGDAYARSGAWAAANLPLGTSLRGKTLGIFGFGRIGRAIARRAEGFGVTIAYCDVTRSAGSAFAYYDNPVALASASDIFVAAVAGGEATRNVVNAGVFEALGPSGLFVNVSRGSVVDEPALIDAIAKKRIGGACLDVFWNEPNIDRRFLEFDNVILQPHQSSGTVETRQAMGKLVRDNLEAHFAGRPLLTPVV